MTKNFNKISRIDWKAFVIFKRKTYFPDEKPNCSGSTQDSRTTPCLNAYVYILTFTILTNLFSPSQKGLRSFLLIGALLAFVGNSSCSRVPLTKQLWSVRNPLRVLSIQNELRVNRKL